MVVTLTVTEMLMKWIGHYSKKILAEGSIIIPAPIVRQVIGVSINMNSVM